MRSPLPACVALLLALPAGAAVAQPARPVVHKLAGLDLEVAGDLKGVTVGLDSVRLAPGLDLVTVKLSSPRAEAPPPFSVKWAIPSHDVTGTWTPGRHFDKGLRPDWARSRLE